MLEANFRLLSAASFHQETRERSKGVKLKAERSLVPAPPGPTSRLSDNDASNMYVFKYANQQMMKLVLQNGPSEGS